MRQIRSILLYIICLSFLFHSTSTVIYAETIFSDSFSNDVNYSLWTLWPSSNIPVLSDFGLSDTNNINWYTLLSTTNTLPSDGIAKVTVRINTSPSNFILSCKDLINTFPGYEKRAYLQSDGTFSLDTYIAGGGYSNGKRNWDNSPGIHQFELICIGTNMILKEDNIILDSWDNEYTFTPDIVRFDYGGGDSEFSNFFYCDGNGCAPESSTTPTPTSTITPTPTATPTPTVTPTPTPTPPPMGTTKMIIIPGFTGSWNKNELTSCTSNPETAIWNQTFNYYTPLQEGLTNAGFETSIFAYDWRRPVSENGARLEQYINSMTIPGEKVHIAAHSMGGLVARWYLEHTNLLNRIDSLLTVGTPHMGANLAYPAWAAGEIWHNDPRFKGFLSLILFACDLQTDLSTKETVRQKIPSVQDLLPTYDYLRDKKSNVLKPITNMTIKNNWLLSSSINQTFFGAYVGALSGNMNPTDAEFTTAPPSRSDLSRGLWTDGKAQKRITSSKGDGTVLNKSSYLPDAINWSVNLNHGELVTSEDGIQEIIAFFTPPALRLSPLLKQNTLKNNNPKQETSALMIVGDPGSFELRDPKNTVLSDVDGLIVVANPKQGNYTITAAISAPPSSTSSRTATQPSDNTLIYVGQITESRTEWKTYKLNKKQKKGIRIDFDSNGYSHHEDDHDSD